MGKGAALVAAGAVVAAMARRGGVAGKVAGEGRVEATRVTVEKVKGGTVGAMKAEVTGGAERVQGVTGGVMVVAAKAVGEKGVVEREGAGTVVVREGGEMVVADTGEAGEGEGWEEGGGVEEVLKEATKAVGGAEREGVVTGGVDGEGGVMAGGGRAPEVTAVVMSVVILHRNHQES